MTDTIVIEKDVPLPEPAYTGRWPFDKMDVGDSFFVAAGTLYPNDPNREVNALRSSASSYSMRWTEPKAKFSLRDVDGGYRVWRTA